MMNTFSEMRNVVTGLIESTDPNNPFLIWTSEDDGLFHAWKNGASLEGIYHGYTLSSRYRRLEKQNPKIKLRLQNGERIIRSVTRLFRKWEKNELNENEVIESLYNLYQDTRNDKIDFGSSNRNRSEEAFLKHWLSTFLKQRSKWCAETQLLWELLNRVHRQ